MGSSYTQKRWSLRDLFPGHESPEMKSASAELEQRVTAFEAARPQLKADIQSTSFLELLASLEAITHLIQRISGYAELWFSENTQDQSAQAFLAALENRLAEISNRVLFFSLWWKGLEEDQAARLLAASGEYRYYLEEMRHFRPHTLSEPEEKVINLKDVTGGRALQTLYSMITNRYQFEIEVGGQKKKLTRGELMVHVRQADPNLRAAAYRELYRVYGQDGPILSQIYSALARDWHNEHLGLRHFAAPLAVRNLHNDLPDAVVDMLLEVCRANAGVFQRFFRLKARWLSLPRLRRYDIYAPVAVSDKRYSFAQATDLVLGSLTRFEPHAARLAERVLAEDHLDSEVRPGKRSGAFCASTVPAQTPWVLSNFQGRAEDVATLAHELGHAIHSMLAAHHSVFTFHSSLPLAETASTFSEMLLIDRMLAEESDPGVRRDLLFHQFDDAYATIGRQAFFALFEKEAHGMVQKGAATDELCQAYLENLRAQFGEAVDVPDEFRWEWVSIPHIYDVPFYVYAYAFGQLLVLALYRQFQAEGRGFIPRYLELLSAGGSASPNAILTRAGLQMDQRAFWQGGFDTLIARIEELEKLPIPKG
jgi:oligoendopeptidase F